MCFGAATGKGIYLINNEALNPIMFRNPFRETALNERMKLQIDL